MTIKIINKRHYSQQYKACVVAAHIEKKLAEYEAEKDSETLVDCAQVMNCVVKRKIFSKQPQMERESLQVNIKKYGCEDDAIKDKVLQTAKEILGYLK